LGINAIAFGKTIFIVIEIMPTISPTYSVMNYHERITIESGKRSGKPCIRGMRITVYDVLSYLASGMTYQEILEDFPYLTQEDILACLSYAADRERQTLLIQV
jgi:uncharacterized protein (DUF433 family)